MRFLFVYETFASEARELLESHAVNDVHLVVARRRELCPRPADLILLRANVGADAAACQIDRKYRKSVEPYVHFTVEPKKFRVHDQLLREWLLAYPPEEPSPPLPSEAFESAAKSTRRLVLCDNALKTADELDDMRWSFAAKAAQVLARMSMGDDTLGPPRNWSSAHAVPFAVNGRVRFTYKVTLRGTAHSLTTEWHLKLGDKTARERAARIYFCQMSIEGQQWVLVAFVGPHPEDGGYTANFGEISTSENPEH